MSNRLKRCTPRVRVLTAAVEISPERLQEVAGRARAAWSEHQPRVALPEAGVWVPHAECVCRLK